MGILRISTRNKLSFTHPTLSTAINQLHNVRWVRRQNRRPVQRHLYPRIDSPSHGEPLVKTTKNHGPIIIIYPSQDTLVNELTGTTPFTTSSTSPSSPRIVVPQPLSSCSYTASSPSSTTVTIATSRFWIPPDIMAFPTSKTLSSATATGCPRKPPSSCTAAYAKFKTPPDRCCCMTSRASYPYNAWGTRKA